MSHLPVLLNEVLDAYSGGQYKVFFEGTVGAGGHASAILEAHPEIELYIACDRDETALEIAKERLKKWKDKIEWIHGPFAEIATYLKKLKVKAIDGFLIDVGVSSMQIDQAERGFSFMKDAPLDMRMDQTSDLTAEMIVNTYSEKEIADILFNYGEEGRSRKVAKAIVEARRKKKIRTTKELVDIVKPVATRGKLHPATLVFQALRIAVNDELGQLEKALKDAIKLTNSGGRLGAISFHSLEDRIVKNIFRDAKGIVEIVTKKPIVPTDAEIRKNPRARSAKFRVVQKIES